MTELNAVQKFIYTRTYARWLEEESRREHLEESVDRYLDFFCAKLPIDEKSRKLAREAMTSLSVMPSMRALWAAGPPMEQNSVCGYNCAFAPISDVRSFSEALFILMSGTGFGFSVERQFVDLLPPLKKARSKNSIVVVEDSRIGWAEAVDKMLNDLWDGYTVVLDVHKVRPLGARLKTMGGRASGPGPLIDLCTFLNRVFDERRKRKQWRLLPINCLDIVCKIAEVVVVGGVRRSSLICLFDAADPQVSKAKTDDWYRDKPFRRMANNSAVFETKPTQAEFLTSWVTLVESNAGEPGIFNREAAIKQMLFSGRRKADADTIVGTNPCGEILLKANEFCNLSSIVVRPEDTLVTLRQKARIAAMFGSWQATQTNFPYIRDDYRKNCEEERLLGVSLTGIMDHDVLNNVNDKAKKWLAEMKHAAIAEVERWSDKLGINMSVSITCVKPEGTSSQLNNSASGIHPRYSRFYVRRYRISASDPLFKLLRDQGVPAFPEVGEEPNTASTWVVEFPVASPKTAKTRKDYTALEQLEHWKMIKEFWCEHNPSCTIYVGSDEWLEVASWCHRNFDDILGVSFLPRTDHVYQLAPYEEINKIEYDRRVKEFPDIDYSKLSEYEMEDNTTGAQELACVSGTCEI